MESDKSPYLQRASWRPRRTDGLVPPKVGRLETQEELMLQYESKAGKKLKSQLEGSQTASILSYSGESQHFYFSWDIH